jgi:hypothetical protein
MTLTPAHARADKHSRSRGKSGPAAVRLQTMDRLSTVAKTPAAPSRAVPATIYVAPPPTGNNSTGDGSAGAPYATIQWALLRPTTVSGDEIRVLPGTYTECINNTAFALGTQKNLDIIADDWIVNGDRTSTIIDGTGQCAFPFSVVNLAGAPPTGSLFEGFTVTGGAASGLFVLGSGAVTNNIISGNTSLDGAGLYAYAGTCFYGDSSILVRNNQITNNTADDTGTCSVGGDPCTGDEGCPVGAECLFSGGDGGGVFVNADAVNSGGSAGCAGGDTSIRVDNNVIDGNGADSAFGGGMYVLTNTQTGRSASVAVTQNLISNNSTLPFSLGYGGGAWIGTFGYGTEQIDFVNNTVSSNTSTGDGGGVSAWIDALSDGSHTINVTDNDIQMNTAEGGGGGMDLFVFARDIALSNDGVQLNAVGNLVVDNAALGNETTLFPGVGGGMTGVVWSQQSNSLVELNVSGNELRLNTASAGGGGIGVVSIADSDPDENGVLQAAVANANIRNNLVATNVATDGGAANSAVGGGILAYAEGIGGIDVNDPVLSNIGLTFNTVAQNTSDIGSGGIELESHTAVDTAGNDGSASVTLTHSIVYDNDGFGVGGPTPGTAGVIPPRTKNLSDPTNTGMLDMTIRFNSLFMNESADFEGWIVPDVGPGHLYTDPLLDGSFLPSQCSDTLDAGDPLIPSELEPAPNGGRVNLGHSGDSPIAVTTLADATGDGVVDGLDLLRLSVSFGSDPINTRWDPGVDFDLDEFITGIDLALLAADFARSCP